MSILDHSTTYTSAGYQFLCGLRDLEKIRQERNLQFTKFIQDNEYDAWHIHDGWVRHKNKSGKVLDKDEIEITLITSHYGSTHRGSPREGGQMVISKHNNNIYDDNIPFNVHVFEVIKQTHPYVFDEFDLKNTHTVKECVYRDGDYHWYEPSRWEKFIRYFTR